MRFSTLSAATGEYLFVHSAYPTTGPSAVFFGPDSYRFAAFLTRTVWKGRRLVDVGCGTGVGGLVLAARVDDVVLADINPSALELAAVNVALAGRDAGGVSLCASDVLAQVPGDVDVVVSNPPYLVGMSSGADGPGRLYRDGGGSLGIDLAMRIAVESLQRLAGAGWRPAGALHGGPDHRRPQSIAGPVGTGAARNRRELDLGGAGPRRLRRGAGAAALPARRTNRGRGPGCHRRRLSLDLRRGGASLPGMSALHHSMVDPPGPPVPATSDEELHRRLTRLNQRRLRPALAGAELAEGPLHADLESELGDRRLEDGFVAAERAAVQELASRAPRDAGRIRRLVRGAA